MTRINREMVQIFFPFSKSNRPRLAQQALQDFLNRSKEWDILNYRFPDIDLQLEDFKDLVDDLRCCNEGSQQSWSAGSTLLLHSAANKLEQAHAEICSLHQDTGTGSESIHIEEPKDVGDCENGVISGATLKQGIFMCCDEQPNNDGVVCVSSSTEIGSPLQVTPPFRSLAAGIPSPKFSESEWSFLLKAHGTESPCPNPSANLFQLPTCKRALLQSL